MKRNTELQLSQAGLFDAECHPSFQKAIPYQCLVEIVTDVKKDPLSAIKNPAILLKLMWAMGCLTTLVADMVSVGLLKPDDVADAFAWQDSLAGTDSTDPVANMANTTDILSDAISELEPYQGNAKAFGIASALSILSAIGAIYKVWKMLAGNGGGDHSRHITKIKLASEQSAG